MWWLYFATRFDWTRYIEFHVIWFLFVSDSLGLHRVENPSHVDRSVSLHLYSPPFDTCHMFDQRTGKKTAAKVTFWSKFGERLPPVIYFFRLLFQSIKYQRWFFSFFDRRWFLNRVRFRRWLRAKNLALRRRLHQIDDDITSESDEYKSSLFYHWK